MQANDAIHLDYMQLQPHEFPANKWHQQMFFQVAFYAGRAIPAPIISTAGLVAINSCQDCAVASPFF